MTFDEFNRVDYTVLDFSLVVCCFNCWRSVTSINWCRMIDVPSDYLVVMCHQAVVGCSKIKVTYAMIWSIPEKFLSLMHLLFFCFLLYSLFSSCG